ncbi:MAG TPA: precorrin-6A reductase [Selenomonas sp.]|nr:precorrin-6A reductase [Selenomonas sp.]
MIFVAAGTQDGRQLAGCLLEHGLSVTASVVSSYGEQLLKSYKGIKINDRPLDEDGLTEYLKNEHVTIFVDASHPYAENVSKNGIAACSRIGIPYIRYERESTPITYEKVHYVPDSKAAAKKAAELGSRIFLTTGSRNLEVFAKSEYLKDCTLTVRVLPTSEVLALCEKLGFTPKQIIAMQGPFSQTLNEAMFKQYDAQVIVTKNSGTIGGADTKFAAAEALGLPIVLIDRPKVTYGQVARSFEDVLAFIRQHEEA